MAEAATIDYMTTLDPNLVFKTSNTFHWADYLLFGLFLAFSLGIGFYYGIWEGRNKKTQTTKEFLMGKDMSVLPVAMAIMSSFLSAILILGTPAEIYTMGTMYFMYTFGMMLSCVFATIIFVPLLYPLKLTSSYEYLQRRFNSKAAKLTGTLILFITQILYLGIALYSPSTALEAVTGFPEWATIVIGGVVSMIYTAMGGMKASVWASFFQTLVMAGGVLAIIIQGAIDVGGLDKIWELNDAGGRIDFFEFDPNPLTRHSFWTLIVGGTIGWLSTYGCNQASVQRYSGMPTLAKGKLVVILNIPGLLFFMLICCFAGMSVFAYYAQQGCDPLAAGFIDNPNQLVPYFVMDRLHIPGIPGLFLACLFGGALSSVSASLGALAAVTWEDILKDSLQHLSEVTKTLITKLLVVFYGAIGIGFAFLASNLEGTVVQASLSFTGASGGPMLGLFLLGGFFPCANWIGAVVGGLIGLAIPLWISVGAYTEGVSSPFLNTTIENCFIPFVNETDFATEGPPPLLPEDVTGFNQVYQISYLWYGAMGAAITVVVGLIVSAVTGCTDPDDIKPKFLIPFFDRFFCCLPEKSLAILRCKIDMPTPEEIEAEQNREDEEKEETNERNYGNGKLDMEPWDEKHGNQNFALTNDSGEPYKRNVHNYEHAYSDANYSNDNADVTQL